MAKIDFSKIEGYESMTVEEKLAALEAMELPDSAEGEVARLKAAVDKATSEAAGYKKQLRERMSEEEAAKAKAAEDMASVMAELENLRAEKAVSEYTAQFMGIGYDEALAKATAQAIQKGATIANGAVGLAATTTQGVVTEKRYEAQTLQADAAEISQFLTLLQTTLQNEEEALQTLLEAHQATLSSLAGMLERDTRAQYEIDARIGAMI